MNFLDEIKGAVMAVVIGLGWFAILSLVGLLYYVLVVLKGRN